MRGTPVSCAVFVGLKSGHVSQGDVRGFGDIQQFEFAAHAFRAVQRGEKKRDGEEGGQETTHFWAWIDFVPT
jgi:hypothetical protein